MSKVYFMLKNGQGEHLLVRPSPQSQMLGFYRAGVDEAINKGQRYIQVWQCTDQGGMLRYDSERTRKLTDKIVAARVARGEHANPNMQVTK